MKLCLLIITVLLVCIQFQYVDFVFTQQIGFGSTGLYDGDIYDGPSNKSV